MATLFRKLQQMKDECQKYYHNNLFSLFVVAIDCFILLIHRTNSADSNFNSRKRIFTPNFSIAAYHSDDLLMKHIGISLHQYEKDIFISIKIHSVISSFVCVNKVYGENRKFICTTSFSFHIDRLFCSIGLKPSNFNH